MHHLKCWTDVCTSQRYLKHDAVIRETPEIICVAWGHWGKFSREWFVNIDINTNITKTLKGKCNHQIHDSISLLKTEV